VTGELIRRYGPISTTGEIRTQVGREGVQEFGMSTEWNESRTELLKRLWIAGESARTIAEKLGRGITRNAVIGKAHRLGLTGKHGSKDFALRPARRSALKSARQRSKRRRSPGSIARRGVKKTG